MEIRILIQLTVLHINPPSGTKAFSALCCLSLKGSSRPSNKTSGGVALMAYDLSRYYGPPLLCGIARQVPGPLLSYGMGRVHSPYFVIS
jgi:hypothetical protein